MVTEAGSGEAACSLSHVIQTETLIKLTFIHFCPVHHFQLIVTLAVFSCYGENKMAKTFFGRQFGGTAVSSETVTLRENHNLTTLSERINDQGNGKFLKCKAKKSILCQFVQLAVRRSHRLTCGSDSCERVCHL